jgi:small subunit ribosomal protein S14
MAKKSVIAREIVRQIASKRGHKAREKLKSIIKNPHASYEEKLTAVKQLNKRSRDESPSRLHNRCQRHKCGRSHGVYRQFALCRIHVREAFVRGDVPGLVKASW